VRKIYNSKVLKSQIAKLQEVRKRRDQKLVDEALKKLQKGAEGKENLLGLAVQASRVRASVGEISQTLEDVFGRYVPVNRVVSGAFKAEYQNEEEIKLLGKEIDRFHQKHGRRPRILVAKLGQDGHDRGAKVIASGFSDLGFDVDIGPLFQTPEEVVRQALDADVHVVGVSSQAAAHRTLVPKVVQLLKDANSPILVVCGGVIPQQDYDALFASGVKAIFGPGTPLLKSAEEVLRQLDPTIFNPQQKSTNSKVHFSSH